MEETDFQQIIKDLRAKRWTQARIAEKCGVTTAYISMLARGERTSPSYDVGRKLVELWELVR